MFLQPVASLNGYVTKIGAEKDAPISTCALNLELCDLMHALFAWAIVTFLVYDCCGFALSSQISQFVPLTKMTMVT